MSRSCPCAAGSALRCRKLLDRPKEVTPESLGLLRAISPLNHVRPGLPPFLLIHGDADKTVPIQQSYDFQAKLQANGVLCDLADSARGPGTGWPTGSRRRPATCPPTWPGWTGSCAGPFNHETLVAFSGDYPSGRVAFL